MANHVTIYGNLGADPELRMTQGGMGVLKLRVATNERVKKGEEWVDHTEWHAVTTFGKRAEGLAKILTKGSKVLVFGKLRTTSYQKEGEEKPRYTTEIIADDIELGGKPGGNQSERAAAPAAPSSDYSGGSVGEDEIPF